MAARRVIRDHKARHNRYLASLVKRHREAEKPGHLVANPWYDLEEDKFRDPLKSDHPKGKPFEVFYEYDLVCFERPADGEDLGNPMWFAEFTAEDQWDREKFIYEAWRWIWFGNRLHSFKGLPAQGWAWVPGQKDSFWELSADQPVSEFFPKEQESRPRPFIYYLLTGIQLHSIWMAGIESEDHRDGFEDVGAIPPNLDIRMCTPNRFEEKVIGRAGSFGQVYRRTKKGGRGG